ncbi:hypothetical protein [Luteitalea sp.]|uniref:hypothetical protein n=1 Tax=Luteitalea sp. TaxID=2004800 RepID=UPI0025BB88EC|nr:hypothetical protein [Luteitalea sp.]
MVWALALAVPAAAQTPGPPVVRDGAAVPAVQTRELLREGRLALVLVQPLPGDGLLGSHLRAIRSGVTTDIPLDGTVTGRRARAIGAVRLLAGGRRVVLHLDPEQEASGLLVVDLAAGAVIDAITGHDLVASPDGRFWAFEEHAIRTVAVWPHTETVYAVYDAAAPPSANVRACPSADDRCRGQVVYLPDRLALCHALAIERGGSCLTPARQPLHDRRSPFVWLSAREVAWVDVDLARQDSTLVIATVRDGAPATVQAVRLEQARVIEDVVFPPAREAWEIEGITRDDDPSRVWLHFRSPVRQAPLRRLGIRVVS